MWGSFKCFRCMNTIKISKITVMLMPMAWYLSLMRLWTGLGFVGIPVVSFIATLTLCCPLAAAAGSGRCGGASEGADPGPDPDEQHDAWEGGRVWAPQVPLRTAAGRPHYLRGERVKHRRSNPILTIFILMSCKKGPTLSPYLMWRQNHQAKY